MSVATEYISDLLAQRTRTFTDEYGSFYAWLEGSYGGDTLMLWLPQDRLEVLLPQLPRQFKGRMVLGLDASGGHATPFARALHWTHPRRVLVLQEGEGLAIDFAGAKAIEGGEWVAWEDPREAHSLEVESRPGFCYRETQAYAPWNAGDLGLGLPKLEGSRLLSTGWELGIPTYGLGLVQLSPHLKALLKLWNM